MAWIFSNYTIRIVTDTDYCSSLEIYISLARHGTVRHNSGSILTTKFTLWCRPKNISSCLDWELRVHATLTLPLQRRQSGRLPTIGVVLMWVLRYAVRNSGYHYWRARRATCFWPTQVRRNEGVRRDSIPWPQSGGATKFTHWCRPKNISSCLDWEFRLHGMQLWLWASNSIIWHLGGRSHSRLY